jgi:hypothetical protein
MHKAITIFFPKGRDKRFLNDLLDTIDTKYPLIITNHDGFQLDALRKTFERTPFDEIFFLNDTMVVKDNFVWNMIFDGTEGKTVSFHPEFQMYLNKYRRDIVEQVPFPEINSRYDDIEKGEGFWNWAYRDLDPDFIMFDPLLDPNPDIAENHEFKYDRDNIVLENKYFKKWKSVWNINML